MYDMATVYSDAGNATPFAMTFAEDLNRRWATFNGAGYLESSELWDNFRAREDVAQLAGAQPIPEAIGVVVILNESKNILCISGLVIGLCDIASEAPRIFSA
jgi:hypothetical protein